MVYDVDLTRDQGLYRALFEHAGDYILLLEPNERDELVIVEANGAAARGHGYAGPDLIGKPISLLDPFSTREFLADSLRSLRAGERILFEAKHRRSDGSTFDVEVRCTPVNVGGRSLVLAVERDVSERKSAELKQHHLRQLMSHVISHARSAIAVHDRDLRYIYVSDRYLKEYGVREHDVIGRHHYEVFPDLPQKWRDVHQRALAGEVLSSEEDPYCREDGRVEWTRWECRPWYEADGAIGGIIVYTEVITERKRAEEERKALEAKLHQAMKMEAIGRLAGGVAHDFNNLLTVMMCHLDLAFMSLADEDALGARLHEVRQAAESAATLTRQLLAFSRKEMIEPRRIDLNELIGSLQKLLGRVIGEDISLCVIPGASLRPVRVDPGQFEQVIVNLAVNARDAMPDGGQLSIETSNVELDESDCSRHHELKPGPHVLLVVSDTGCGMSEDVQRHLFEPFFTTKGLGRGTGLGLATIFGIVHQVEGAIEVYSEVGHGTSFKVYLPALEGPVSPLEPDVRTPEMPPGNETILVVEDNEGIRRVATQVLERLGYSVIAAPTGPEALARVEHYRLPIHLLLTDVVMPGMNGRELATRFQAQFPDAKVLYASGYTENVIGHHGVVDENLSFIAKPYSPAALARKVRELLGGPGRTASGVERERLS